MPKISAIAYGQLINKQCKKCGKPIMYAINGEPICMDCYKPKRRKS